MSTDHTPEAPTLSELAGYAYDQFASFTRDGSDKTLYKTREGAPEWVCDLVRAAHDDLLPDDHRYGMIHSALGGIHDVGADDAGELDYYGHDHEIADGMVSVYNAARYAWLASHHSRAGYVDDAVAEYGVSDEGGISAAIAMGWYSEAREVVASVASSLSDRLEAIADARPDVEESADASAHRVALAHWRDDFPEVAAIEATR